MKDNFCFTSNFLRSRSRSQLVSASTMPRRKLKGVEQAKRKAQTLPTADDGKWRGARLVPPAAKLPGSVAFPDVLDELEDVVTELHEAKDIKTQIATLRSAPTRATSPALLGAWARLLVRLLLHDDCKPLKGALCRALEELTDAQRYTLESVVSSEVCACTHVQKCRHLPCTFGGDVVIVLRLHTRTQVERIVADLRKGQPDGEGGVVPLLQLWQLPPRLAAAAGSALSTLQRMARVLQCFEVLLEPSAQAAGKKDAPLQPAETEQATQLLKVMVGVLQHVADRIAMLAQRDSEHALPVLEVASRLAAQLHEVLTGGLVHRDVLTAAAMARALLLQITAGAEDSDVLEALILRLFPSYHRVDTRGWPPMGDPNGEMGEYSLTAQLATHRALTICASNGVLLLPLRRISAATSSSMGGGTGSALGVFAPLVLGGPPVAPAEEAEEAIADTCLLRLSLDAAIAACEAADNHERLYAIQSVIIWLEHVASTLKDPAAGASAPALPLKHPWRRTVADIAAAATVPTLRPCARCGGGNPYANPRCPHWG